MNMGKLQKLFIVFSFLVFPVFCFGISNQKPKLIALSFDDGPHTTYTEEVLAVLKKNNIKATFFVMGGCVHNHPDLLQKEYEDGNAIGNHTYTHPNLSKLSDAAVAKELTRADDIIYKTIHVRPAIFRPPYGACSANCTATANRLGIKKVTWSYLVNDWDVDKTSSDIIATSLIKHAYPGAILAMHDGSGNRQKTVDALPRVIATLKNKGYQFVTIPELLKIQPYRNENRS